MRYGLHVVDLAEVYVLYIFVTGALHHLDLEFLSLSKWCKRPSFRELIESEKKNACLRVEYHHNVIVGG